jgi:hypothetical protein
MATFKITHDKVDKYVNLLVVGFYPSLREIHHFGFNKKTDINKDEFMVGIWKLKQLKN